MSNHIRKVRIEREKQVLAKIQTGFQHEWDSNGIQDFINFEINSTNNLQEPIVIKGCITLLQSYPFSQPLIKLHLSKNEIIFQNCKNNENVDFYYNKKWSPKMTVVDIISVVDQYCKNKIFNAENILQKQSFFKILYDIQQVLGNQGLLFFTILIYLIVRILISLGPYSGYNDPPQYGDYEAQRHWMELTVNLPAQDWYKQTPYNDLDYWRIDYPPLSAFLALVLGYFSQIYDEKSIELFESRGYETKEHKFFMRSTVYVTDFIFFFTAVYFLIKLESKKFSNLIKETLVLLILLCPPFILVDHGHFQYNSVMLGLMLWGIYFCVTNNIVIGSILYTAAFNFKQLGLYYSLPFFVFILGKICITSGLRSRYIINKIDLSGLPIAIINITIVGVAVICTCIAVWSPWLIDLNLLKSTLQAIFPVQRGLYQLKVANFWCFSSIFIKWTEIFTQDSLIFISIILTLSFSIPCLVLLFLRPKLKYFKLCIFIVSLSFFFFSYHVHEKTILLPLAGLILNIRYFGQYYFKDFVIMASFTMYHMLKEDGLVLQYICLNIFYILVLQQIMTFFNQQKILKQTYLNEIVYSINKKENNLQKLGILLDMLYKKIIRRILLVGIIFGHLADQFIEPPENYPFIYNLLFAMLGFLQFGFCFIQANIFIFYQFWLTKSKDKVNLNKED